MSFLNFFGKKWYRVVLTFVAGLNALFYYPFRISTLGFVDIFLFDGAADMFLWLMIINALVSLFPAALSVWGISVSGRGDTALKAVTLANTVIAAVFWIFTIVLLAISSSESLTNYGVSLLKDLPYGLIATGAAAILLFVPAMKGGSRLVVSGIFAAVVVLGIASSVYGFVPYDFVAAPMVIDRGDGYSVVFATTDAGTGYIEYAYEGENYRVFDSVDGRIEHDSMIHSVFVPYEHLDGNSYRVGSERVYQSYGYGARKGREIVSPEFTFTAVRGDIQRYLCISDWHTYMKLAWDAIGHLGEYDGVLMLGDAVPELGYEENAAEYIVRFGGELTNGGKPVVFIRGNHETRGEYSPKLSGALGLDGFNREINAGKYRFIALDSGEDKADDHPEYGGLADFKKEREKMVEYIEGLEYADYTVALCHSPELCREEELSERAFEGLTKAGASVLLSGDWHILRLDGEERDFPVFIDGGHSSGKLFIGNIVELSPEGIHIVSMNDDGEKLLDERLPWKNAA